MTQPAHLWFCTFILHPQNSQLPLTTRTLHATRLLICDAPENCASGFVNCPHPQTPSRFLEGGFWCGMTDYDTKQTDSCRSLPKRENPDLHGAANTLRERQFHARNCCRKSHSKSCSERSVGSSPTTGTTSPSFGRVSRRSIRGRGRKHPALIHCRAWQHGG